jgi:drug/metabolite transporter (DMT)-like permease
VAYLLAVLAAFSNALSSICQRLGVQRAPQGTAMGWSLIKHALRQLVWFLGVSLIAAGFLLQAVALRFGQLSSVQPIVTTELLFLVLILGVWFRYSLTWMEWVGTSAAAGGLAVFLIVASPGGGSAIPSAGSWILVFLVIGGIAAMTASLGRTGPRWFRAAMYGTAGAVMFALSAALTKQLSTLVTEGWGHVFVSWVPYALAVTDLTGLYLIQNSFHAGPITASQATITLIDPITSVCIGMWLFHDRLDASLWRVPIELLAVVVVVAGVVVLSRSPLVAGARDDSPAADKLRRQPSRHDDHAAL